MRQAAGIMLFVLLFCPAHALAGDAQEREMIKRLIASVEGLNGAVFLRNGTEHSPKEAADHLRLKLKKAGDRVRTAEDFIRLCASRSYLTGEPYRIRLSDGATVEAEAYFRNKLKELARDDNEKQREKK